MKLIKLLILLMMAEHSMAQGNFANVESFIDIVLINERGENLIPKDTNNINSIDILYLNSKKEKEIVFNPNAMASKGFLYDTNTQSLRLYLSLPLQNESISETYFRYKDQGIDVFKTEFDIQGASIVRKKIWLNDRLIWERENNSDKYPSIIKY